MRGARAVRNRFHRRRQYAGPGSLKEPGTGISGISDVKGRSRYFFGESGFGTPNVGPVGPTVHARVERILNEPAGFEDDSRL